MSAAAVALAGMAIALAILGWRDEPAIARLWDRVLSPAGLKAYATLARRAQALDRAIRFNEEAERGNPAIGAEMRRELDNIAKARGLWRRMLWAAARE